MKKTSIHELSGRSQRAQRKKWRETKKIRRAKVVSDQNIPQKDEENPSSVTMLTLFSSKIQNSKSKLSEHSRTNQARENLHL